ncbi:hypothetical protein HUG15_20070 [Salicibibacter cibarius]|uniref:Uncharacterized protein n=1 Tax=Salicibibacter cibarius TaxID=2743000 RepID=A0A7T6Z6N8_9BACI|nr:hypothetical protein HUG15_20070 [Salicibibacter cibarius]
MATNGAKSKKDVSGVEVGGRELLAFPGKNKASNDKNTFWHEKRKPMLNIRWALCDSADSAGSKGAK